MIAQCPMSNSSELFSYPKICSSFKCIEPFLSVGVLEYTDTKTDGWPPRHTQRHTDKHEYSIVAVDKPQL